MGNYCINELIEPGFQTNPENVSFIRASWALLKKNHQLAFITAKNEKEILGKLNIIPPKKEPIKVLLTDSVPNHCIIIKQNTYLYVGKVTKELMQGVGAVALPKEKLFIGDFKNGRIEGSGEFLLKTNCSKPVRLKG